MLLLWITVGCSVVTAQDEPVTGDPSSAVTEENPTEQESFIVDVVGTTLQSLSVEEAEATTFALSDLVDPSAGESSDPIDQLAVESTDLLDQLAVESTDPLVQLAVESEDLLDKLIEQSTELVDQSQEDSMKLINQSPEESTELVNHSLGELTEFIDESPEASSEDSDQAPEKSIKVNDEESPEVDQATEELPEVVDQTESPEEDDFTQEDLTEVNDFDGATVETGFSPMEEPSFSVLPQPVNEQPPFSTLPQPLPGRPGFQRPQLKFPLRSPPSFLKPSPASSPSADPNDDSWIPITPGPWGPQNPGPRPLISQEPEPQLPLQPEPLLPLEPEPQNNLEQRPQVPLAQEPELALDPEQLGDTTTRNYNEEFLVTDSIPTKSTTTATTTVRTTTTRRYADFLLDSDNAEETEIVISDIKLKWLSNDTIQILYTSGFKDLIVLTPIRSFDDTDDICRFRGELEKEPTGSAAVVGCELVGKDTLVNISSGNIKGGYKELTLRNGITTERVPVQLGSILPGQRTRRRARQN